MAIDERWHEERQSAWIYRSIAPAEPDPRLSKLFLGLADAAEKQAGILEQDLRDSGATVPEFHPALRARLVALAARRLGLRRTRTMLAAVKVRGLSAVDALSGTHAMPASTEEIGARHRRAGGSGSLRAAVFGVNDGLVSNTSLVLGMAGASGDAKVIVATGIAGLLAGAFSMAAGEYLSVRSQRELFEFQIAEEREELERYPEEEAEELALIYAARGVPLEDARTMTRLIVQDKEKALDTLAREELGLNPAELGSPWGAASSSFTAFALGALVPLLPFVLHLGAQPIVFAGALSGVCLFGVGAVLSLFSGKHALVGGLRMLLIGAAAGGATFGIGRLLGVSVS
ncbi:MAG: VIT1/CCC1 transporter family protein [Planctomycetes bacterium]|nr:VIT1/CCC1 transporter family protein [Planctomycetota bacterium]